jgi:hypothetical protein
MLKVIKQALPLLILSICLFAVPFFLHAAVAKVSLVISPSNIIQGDPIMISVQGISSVASTTLYFDGKRLKSFLYKNQPTALYGFDIHKVAGIYLVSAKLPDGTLIKRSLIVGERKMEQVVFSIPVKLGGNTVASQTKFVSTLQTENASLVGLQTVPKPLWVNTFRFPVKDPIVTDSYGYSRQTGAASVLHKGTDFRATEGTPVMSINRGIVRLVQNTRNYGKTVVVDHGLGVMSLYMHLSKIYVNSGDEIDAGQYVGLSGQTGYAEAPHLHLTLRINDISIDPIRFFELFP